MIYPEYDSPFKIIIQRMAEEVARDIDDMCEEALAKAAVDIDKETLLNALKQDKERYVNAYERGYETAKSEQVRCENCEFYDTLDCFWKLETGSNKDPDWYCADGRKKDEGDI